MLGKGCLECSLHLVKGFQCTNTIHGLIIMWKSSMHNSSRFPQSELTVLSECGYEVLVWMVDDTNHILLMRLKEGEGGREGGRGGGGEWRSEKRKGRETWNWETVVSVLTTEPRLQCHTHYNSVLQFATGGAETVEDMVLPHTVYPLPTRRQDARHKVSTFTFTWAETPDNLGGNRGTDGVNQHCHQ